MTHDKAICRGLMSTKYVQLANNSCQLPLCGIGHKPHLPQRAVYLTFSITSVRAWISGFGLCSSATCRGPLKTTACIMTLDVDMIQYLCCRCVNVQCLLVREGAAEGLSVLGLGNTRILKGAKLGDFQDFWKSTRNHIERNHTNTLSLYYEPAKAWYA
jgi:hypothetical protein